MSRPSLWKAVFVFALVLVLAAPAARAAGSEPEKGARTPWEILGQVWDLLERFWAEHGCILDPDGRCLPDSGTSSATGENGCAADPDGRCQPDSGTSSATGDHGCVIDPDGRCIG